MALNHMKICLPLLLIREIQMKTTHFSTIQLVKIQKFDNTLCWHYFESQKFGYNLNSRGLDEYTLDLSAE